MSSTNMAEPPTPLVWILLLRDDEGALATVFSTQAKAVAYILEDLRGPLYWKTHRREFAVLWEADANAGAWYTLYAEPLDDGF